MNKRFLLKKLSVSGDTLIEVALAMTLLTMFLFISWGITNKSTQISMNSRKRVEMVNIMKEQAESLKAQYNDATARVEIKTLISETPGIASQTDPCAATPANTDSFYYSLDSTQKLVKISGPKNSPDDANRVWIQYKSVAPNLPADPTGYDDYYVRGCWQTTGGVQNTDSAQFVVRLNK